MSKRKPRVPNYCLHKPSGQAIVRLDGRAYYLGKHGTKASREEYARLIAEWLAAGERVPGGGPDTTVVEVMAAFLKAVKPHYTAREFAQFTDVQKILVPLYGRLPAAQFGPRAFKTVRDEMVRKGWCRSVVNNRARRVKRIFKWAVAEEMVPPDVYHGLQAVEGLRRGRTDAPETKPVRPVAQKDVDAVLPHLSPTVAAMVRLQLLTGMRPGEVCILRTGDVDRSGKVWLHTPGHHKTEWVGRSRVIHLGPKAQAVLKPFLKADPAAYVFSPKDVVEGQRAARHAARKTPIRYGNRPGTNRKRTPKWAAGERYDVAAYRRAIHRVCDRLNDEATYQKKLPAVERWSPNQLRHSAGTFLRKNYGLDVARAVLGHSSPVVTEVYAELDSEKAAQAMGEVG